MATIRTARADAQPTRRVLVVDDHLDTVDSLAMLLKTMGHEVQFAITGTAAVDIARAFRPEIVLLDFGLPDVKGDQGARGIRSEPGLENGGIIVITGRKGSEEHTAA